MVNKPKKEEGAIPRFFQSECVPALTALSLSPREEGPEGYSLGDCISTHWGRCFPHSYLWPGIDEQPEGAEVRFLL